MSVGAHALEHRLRCGRLLRRAARLERLAEEAPPRLGIGVAGGRPALRLAVEVVERLVPDRLAETLEAGPGTRLVAVVDQLGLGIENAAGRDTRRRLAEGPRSIG
jgi:hypothetical protein